MSHLREEELQALADGTLRGPAGLAAREHCEACAGCGAELAALSALCDRLALLRDPPPPDDFTAAVLAAVDAREARAVQARQTVFAVAPALLLAALAMAGWISSLPGEVGKLVAGFTLLRHVAGAATPVFAAVRLPLAAAALLLLTLILAALSRTLRPSPRGAVES